MSDNKDDIRNVSCVTMWSILGYIHETLHPETFHFKKSELSYIFKCGIFLGLHPVCLDQTLDLPNVYRKGLQKLRVPHIYLKKRTCQ